MPLDLVPLPPAEAIRALQRRGGRLDPSFSWQDAWQEDHAAMFTVAKSAGFDILKDIYDALERALAEGRTFRDFAQELKPVLQAKGWWGRKLVDDPQTGERVAAQLGSSRRLRTIFDTNMRVSYAAGHWAHFERTKPARPFLRYVALLDDRTRPSHRARHNLVLPVDHLYWEKWAPPCGWNCRCTLQSLSQRDIDRLQLQGQELAFDPPQDTFRNFVNKRTGEVSAVPDGIDPGWAYNPGKAGWQKVEEASRAKLDEAQALFGTQPPSWPKPPTTEAELRGLLERIEKGQAQWRAGLTRDETEAIATYKGSGHHLMNGVLREDGLILGRMGKAGMDAAQILIDDMRAALAKAKLPEAITVFRGVPKAVGRRFEETKPGDPVADPGFFSSSVWEPVARRFDSYIVEVRIMKGTPGAALIHSIPDVDHLEYEVVLAPGCRMEVVQRSADRLILQVSSRWQSTGRS